MAPRNRTSAIVSSRDHAGPPGAAALGQLLAHTEANDHLPRLPVQHIDASWIDVSAQSESTMCNVGDCLVR